MWISAAEDGNTDPDVQALLDRSRDPDSGKVDHILQVHSLHPPGLAAHLAVYCASMASTRGLRKVDRETIAVVVSALNHCHY